MRAAIPRAPNRSRTSMPKLRTAIEDLLHHQPWTVMQAMDRHFGPDFRHCVNGNWVDRAAFAARIVGLRALVERATITVLDELLDGERYAQRHVIDLHLKDGERVVQEVYVFAQLDPDGRFHRIVEATVVMEL